MNVLIGICHALQYLFYLLYCLLSRLIREDICEGLINCKSNFPHMPFHGLHKGERFRCMRIFSSWYFDTKERIRSERLQESINVI